MLHLLLSGSRHAVFTYTFRFSNYGIALIFGVYSVPAFLRSHSGLKFRKDWIKKTFRYFGAWFICRSTVFSDTGLSEGFVAGQAVVFPFAALSGLNGQPFTLPLSMVADTIDVEELVSGEKRKACITDA